MAGLRGPGPRVGWGAGAGPAPTLPTQTRRPAQISAARGSGWTCGTVEAGPPTSPPQAPPAPTPRPCLAAGAFPAGPAHPEHLRERLSHDAAGPGHVGPLRGVDADRYVAGAPGPRAAAAPVAAFAPDERGALPMGAPAGGLRALPSGFGRFLLEWLWPGSRRSGRSCPDTGEDDQLGIVCPPRESVGHASPRGCGTNGPREAQASPCAAGSAWDWPWPDHPSGPRPPGLQEAASGFFPGV